MSTQKSAAATAALSYAKSPAPRLLMRLALVPALLDSIAEDVAHILEIGPGLGDLSVYLAHRFPAAEIRLIDISENGTNMLRERVRNEAGLSVVTGDFRRLQTHARYDLVVACEVFEHIEDDHSAFRAASQLIHRGGYFLFSAPAFMRKWGAADEYAGHYRRYERAEIESKFREHGFELEKIWCYGFPVTALLQPLYRFYYGRQLSSQPLSMTAATKRSGTERSLVNRFSKLPVAAMMKPFFLCQNLVKHWNIGDGYLVLARKI